MFATKMIAHGRPAIVSPPRPLAMALREFGDYVETAREIGGTVLRETPRSAYVQCEGCLRRAGRRGDILTGTCYLFAVEEL